MRLRVILLLALLLVSAGSPRPAVAVWNTDYEQRIIGRYGQTFTHANVIPDRSLTDDPNSGHTDAHFELVTDDNGNELLVSEAQNSDAYLGAQANAFARIETPDLSESPKLKISVEASAPVRPDDYPPQLSGETAIAIASFDDYLTGSPSGASSQAMTLRFGGGLASQITTNPYEAAEHADAYLEFEIFLGDQNLLHVRKITSREGTYNDNGTVVSDSFVPILNWSDQPIFELTLPRLPVFAATHFSMTARAFVHADNGYVGPTYAKVDATHTMEVVGLIPYDANGNVLPSNSLVVTGQSGFRYPVLGSDVPEPSSLSGLVALVGIGAYGPAWRRRACR